MPHEHSVHYRRVVGSNRAPATKFLKSKAGLKTRGLFLFRQTIKLAFDGYDGFLTNSRNFLKLSVRLSSNPTVLATRASVVTSKPAICGHFKTGHGKVPGT